MCKSEGNKVAKAERVASLEEEITNGTKLKVSVNEEFKDGLENITIMMDRGFSDESLAEMCSWIYLPTRRTPKFPLHSARPPRVRVFCFELITSRLIPRKSKPSRS